MSKENSTSNFVLRFKNVRKPLFVLFIGLLLTFGATIHYHKILETQAKHDYLINCNEIKIEILNGMHSQSQIIRVASAFIESSDTVSSQDWKTFYQQSLVEKELPGIRSFGYVAVVSNGQQKGNIQTIRKDGCPADTTVSSEVKTFQTSCMFIEPFNDTNSRFLGYDMFAKPIRRKAMELAIDSDLVALSGKVILEHETSTVKEASTLMYVPVFRNGSPTSTVEQRRKAIKGWVYSAYHMDDLMRGIIGRKDSIAHNKIHLQIFDDSISGQSLLYDRPIKEKSAITNDSIWFVSIPVLIGGKKWILNFNQYKESVLHFQSFELIRFIGLFTINFLLFFLLLSLQNTTLRANKIAEQLTRRLSITNKELDYQNEELKRSEDALRNSNVFNETLLKTIPFGMDIVDDAGTVLFQSDNFKEIFGENAIGGKCWDLYRDDKKQCIDCPLTKDVAVGKTETSESYGILGDRIFEINHTGMIYQGKKAV
ncbi:MAG: CHASE domain-containing protein, partial [Bacteroidia bacterium]